MRKQRHFSSQIEQLESRIVLSSLSLSGRVLRIEPPTDLAAPAEVQLIDDAGSDQKPTVTQSEALLEKSNSEPSSVLIDQPTRRVSHLDQATVSKGSRLPVETALKIDVSRIKTTNIIETTNDHVGNPDRGSTIRIASDLDSKLETRKTEVDVVTTLTDQKLDSRLDRVENDESLKDNLLVRKSDEEQEECPECSPDTQSAQLMQFLELESSEVDTNRNGEGKQVASNSTRKSVLIPTAHRLEVDSTNQPAINSADTNTATQVLDVKREQPETQELKQAIDSESSESEWQTEDVVLAEMFVMTVSLPFSRKYLSGSSNNQSATPQNFNRSTVPTSKRQRQGTGTRRKWRHRIRDESSNTFSPDNSLKGHIRVSASKMHDEMSFQNRPKAETELNDAFFMSLLELSDRQDQSNSPSESIMARNDITETIMAITAVVGTGYFTANQAQRRREKMKSSNSPLPVPRYTGPTVIR